MNLRVVALAVGAAVLSLPACLVSETCNCPAGIDGMVTVPGDTSRSLSLVLTDELDCLAWDSGAATSGREVTVSRNNPGTCHVHAEFMDQTAYEFTVDFASVGPGCCSRVTTVVGMSAPQRVTTAANRSM